MPSSACLNQNIILENESVNAVSYEWDFCQGDLQLSPVPSKLLNLASSGASITVGSDFIYEGGAWYGFFCSLSTNSIFRLDFGSDINNPSPAITNLGTMGGALKGPQDIRVLKDGSSFFAFVSCRQGNKLTRLSFGSSITNVPTADVILNGNAVVNSGLDVAHDGTTWVVVQTNVDNITVIRLAGSLGSAVDLSSDVLTSSTIPNTDVIGDISLIIDNNQWYGLAVSVNTKALIRISFGPTLFANPSVTDVTTGGIPSNVSPFGITCALENGRFQAFVSTIQGVLIRYDFGNTLTNIPTFNNLNILTTLTDNTLKVVLVRDKSRYYLFTSNWSSNDLYKISFPQSVCKLSQSYSNTDVNPLVTTQGDGVVAITLMSYSSNALVRSVTNMVSVSSTQSPDANFNTEGMCVGNNVSFHPATPDLTYNWDFGDNSTTSSSANPGHVYNTASTYYPVLTVSANGCQNISRKTIRIYDAPNSSFTLPTGLVCTNNEFVIANTTTDVYDGNLKYQWYLAGVPVSTERDLRITFNITGDQLIKLAASIPGCTNENMLVLQSVQSGPSIDFDFAGHCQEEVVAFQGEISETVTTKNWSVDGIVTSDQLQMQYAFQNSGDHEVALSAVSTNGCNTTKKMLVRIYSKPQPYFEVSAPPLSCALIPTPFTNLTPDPTDSDISNYKWNFGTGSEEVTAYEPSFTFNHPGDYQVRLTVTTDQGCVNSIEKPITIASSPNVFITNSPPCVGVPVDFTANDDNIVSYFWEIGTAYYTTKKMTHTFSTPGQRVVRVTATGTNNCYSITDKIITVPAKLTPDFSVTKNCVGVDAQFTDITQGNDPITQRSWNFNSQGTSSDATPTFSFNTLGNKTVKLDLQTQGGCQYSVTKVVQVVEKPIAAFTPQYQTAVPPIDMVFTNQSQFATNYLWTFQTSAAPQTSTAVNPVFTFTDVGEFQVSLTATNTQGCEDVTSKIISLVSPLPDVDLKLISLAENPDGSMKVIITIQNKGNTILRNLPVEIDLSGTIALTETVRGPIEPNQMYNLVLSYGLNKTQSLQYLCAVAELDGDLEPEGNRLCKNFEESIVVSPAYPNPATDKLTIEWVANGNETVAVSLIDSFGKQVWNSTSSSLEGLNHMVWDIRGLNTGIYLLRIIGKSSEGLKTERIQRIAIVTQN